MNVRTPSAKTGRCAGESAILTELVKQTELAKVTLRKETPLIQVIDRLFYLWKFGNAKSFGVVLAGFW
jgi:hypothetical protein